MAEKELRFGLVMTAEERKALDALARSERISQAAVLRRLLWRAAQDAKIPTTHQESHNATTAA